MHMIRTHPVYLNLERSILVSNPVSYLYEDEISGGRHGLPSRPGDRGTGRVPKQQQYKQPEQ